MFFIYRTNLFLNSFEWYLTSDFSASSAFRAFSAFDNFYLIALKMSYKKSCLSMKKEPVSPVINILENVILQTANQEEELSSLLSSGDTIFHNNTQQLADLINPNFFLMEANPSMDQENTNNSKEKEGGNVENDQRDDPQQLKIKIKRQPPSSTTKAVPSGAATSSKLKKMKLYVEDSDNKQNDGEFNFSSQLSGNISDSGCLSDDDFEVDDSDLNCRYRNIFKSFKDNMKKLYLDCDKQIKKSECEVDRLKREKELIDRRINNELKRINNLQRKKKQISSSINKYSK